MYVCIRYIQADLSSSSLQPLKLLLPEGLRDPWSVNAGKQLTLRVKLDGKWK